MTAAIRPTFALFTRALREDNRSKFPTIIRSAAALFLLFLVWLNSSSFRSQSAPGRELLMMIAMVNFFGLTITGLGTFCSAITEEKEDETLGLLRMTRLNPLAILLGKSTARLTSGLLFLSVQLPFTMLCATLGGVSFAQIGKVYAILAAYLFFLCNLGLLWSTLSRRTSRATSFTLLSLVIFYILPVILFFTSKPWQGGLTGGPSSFVLFLGHVISYSPFFDLIDTFFASPAFFPVRPDSILPSLMGGGAAFLLSWAVFDRVCTDESTITKVRPKKRNTLRIRARAWRSAIAWKDFHYSLNGIRGIFTRFFIYSVLILGFLLIIANTNGRPSSAEDIGSIISIMALIIFTVELGALASRMFGVERKNKTLGSIFLLPQATVRLIWQKIWSGALSFAPSLTLFIAGQLILSTDYRRSAEPVEMTAIIMMGYAASQYIFFAILVAYLSLRMRKGALLLGLLAAFLGNIIARIGVSLFFFRTGSDYETMMHAYYLALIFLLIIAAFILAVSIPDRLAHCAAEE